MNTQQLGKTGLEVSRIGLGTVEIGLAYGLGNTGLPSEQDAISLLKGVVELGVTYIDTARGYGLAEERIGKSGIGKNPNIIIGTKFGQFLKQERDLYGESLNKRIREDIDTSRRNLNQETLQLVQFHNELEDYDDFSEIIEIMQKLKDERKVSHVGIAVRGERVAAAAIESNFFETIQVAYNIVDQRMSANILSKAREHAVGVINRSVLLKGALTPARQTLPPGLSQLKRNADAAEEIAKGLGIDLPTLALRFVLSNPGVSTALIGTVKQSRIESALNAAEQGPLPDEILEQLRALEISTPEQIDPSKWPQT